METDNPSPSAPAPDASARPMLNIVGTKVAFGPTRKDLLPLYVKWMNDFELRLLLGDPVRPSSVEQVSVLIDKLTDDQSRCSFVLYELATLRPIGWIGLNGIDLTSRTASFVISIGEADCRGLGYGTEATRLMLDYAFGTLGLLSVRLEVHGFNERAIRAYQKAGFRSAGRWRQAYSQGGKAFDVLCMDCLASEHAAREQQ